MRAHGQCWFRPVTPIHQYHACAASRHSLAEGKSLIKHLKLCSKHKRIGRLNRLWDHLLGRLGKVQIGVFISLPLVLRPIEHSDDSLLKLHLLRSFSLKHHFGTTFPPFTAILSTKMTIKPDTLCRYCYPRIPPD